MSKQTAVEYLEYMFMLQGAIYKNDIDKALKMEKEQIMDAFDKGLITENVYYGYDDKKSEQYYNQTFKSE